MEDILFHYGGFLFLMEVILLRKMDLFSMLSHYPQMSSLISLLFLMEDILFHYGGFLFLIDFSIKLSNISQISLKYLSNVSYDFSLSFMFFPLSFLMISCFLFIICLLTSTSLMFMSSHCFPP